MKVTPVDPRDGSQESSPTHVYRVVFWQRPSPPPGIAPDRLGWHEATFEVTDAADVLDVIDWAESEGRSRQAIYTLWAKAAPTLDQPGGRLIWLAGADPNAHPDRPNFGRELPTGVDPRLP